MKTSKTLFAIIICLTIVHQSCVYDRFDGRLEIVNLSGVSISIDDGQGPTPEYPSLNQTEYFLRDTIAVDEKKSLIQTNLDWSKYIKKSKNKRLNLFIYNLDTLKKYDDINILIKNLNYKKIMLTENELDSLDWKVEIKPNIW